MRLVILVGIPASGKSSFYQKNLSDCQIISKDIMGGKHKQDRQLKMLREYLSQQVDVVIDNCNVSIDERKSLIGLGKELGAEIICYYFPPNPKLSLTRNAGREGKKRVPDFVVWMKNKELQTPLIKEGFDHIFYVKAMDGDFVLEERLDIVLEEVSEV